MENPQRMRIRSNIHLVAKTTLPPEARKLKDEAEKMMTTIAVVDSTQAGAKDTKDNTVIATESKPLTIDRTKQDVSTEKEDINTGKNTLIAPQNVKKASDFSSYKDLAEHPVPSDKPMPEGLRSPYLSEQQNLTIWKWLNMDEKPTKLSFFLEMCSWVNNFIV